MNILIESIIEPFLFKAKYGYRAGSFNPNSPAETLKEKGIGIVNSKVGLLGTGYYFVSKLKDAIDLKQKVNYPNLSKIDLSSYKLYRPSDPTGFYEAIKDTTYYIHSLKKEDLTDPETKQNIQDAAEAFSEELNLNKKQVIEIFKEYIKDVLSKKDGNLLSNRLLANYDGIDMTGTPYDDFGAGSLIFNGKLKPDTYEEIEPTDYLQELKNINEKKGFNPKLGKDPFGMSQYSRELAQGLEENTPEPKDNDISYYIENLIDFFLKKYPQIDKLPSIEYIDNDIENAKNFFGKTAYYDPNTKTIVLYTKDRHPRDIVSSFCHEFIHFIQDLEGRLDDIFTQNIWEDDKLEMLEREAYEKGGIMLRAYKDFMKNRS